MYAVIKTGGKQYRVAAGDKVKVEKLDLAEGDAVVFSEVLLAGEGESVSVGSPVLADASVKGTVLGHGRGKKVIVYKYKRRKGQHKKQGHRQDYTLVRIDEVLSGAPASEPAEEAAGGEE